MIRLRLSTDAIERVAIFRRIVPDVVEYALATALTRTGVRIKDAMRAEMPRVFDRPTPFTLNALYLKPATAKDPEAIVGLKESAPTYPREHFQPQVYGGGRRQKKFERALQRGGHMPSSWYAVPAKGARLDRYGNVNGANIERILSALGALSDKGAKNNRTTQSRLKRGAKLKDYFAVTPNNAVPASNGGRLPYGIYERLKNGRIRSWFIFVPRVRYRPRLAFFEVAQRTFNEHFGAELTRGYSDVSRAFQRRGGTRRTA